MEAIKNLEYALRRFLLKTVKPFLEWCGKIHAPFAHKKIKSKEFFELSKKLEPGFTFITHIDGELTNVLIPGFWTHAAIYIGDNKVVEAIGKGVVVTDLLDFCFSKDYIAVLRPAIVSYNEQLKAAEVAKDLATKNLPYDYGFDPDDTAFYCGEAPAFCYKKGAAPRVIDWVGRETLGVDTYAPQDYWNADKKFDLMWTNYSGSRGK